MAPVPLHRVVTLVFSPLEREFLFLLLLILAVQPVIRRRRRHRRHRRKVVPARPRAAAARWAGALAVLGARRGLVYYAARSTQQIRQIPETTTAQIAILQV